MKPQGTRKMKSRWFWKKLPILKRHISKALNSKEGLVMSSMVVTLSLCLLVTSAQAGTFRDNFDVGKYDDDWEIVDIMNPGSSWTVENGELICRRANVWVTILQFGEPNWRNYSIEADAKMVEILSAAFHTVGFELRLGERDQLVWLAMGRGGTPIAKQAWIWGLRAPGQAAAHARSKGFNPALNQWYHLKAVADGKNFEFYIDGELLVTLEDFSLAPTGAVALAVGGSVAHFDNVVITGDDVPDNTNPSAVSASGKLATTWGQLRSQ